MLDIYRKLIFTHPQKCGGTTIEGAFKWHPNYVNLIDAPHYEKHFNKLKHASLTEQIEYVESLGHSQKDFFKFSCIRNPWDLLVSWYYFDKHHGFKAAQGSFEEYVTRRFRHENILDMTLFFYHNGAFSIDYVIRYENYKQDAQYILDKYQVSWQDNFNTKSRPRNTAYQDVHTELTKKIVQEKAGFIIDNFGYTF